MSRRSDAPAWRRRYEKEKADRLEGMLREAAKAGAAADLVAFMAELSTRPRWRLRCEVPSTMMRGKVVALRTLADLCSWSRADLMLLDNMGRVSVAEIEAALLAGGLRLHWPASAKTPREECYPPLWVEATP